jgi:undecaprenyl-diphosphatase
VGRSHLPDPSCSSSAAEEYRFGWLIILGSIPIGAGVLETPKALGQGGGAVPTAVGTLVSFVVADASVAWLLRFVSHNQITVFVPYRVVLGLAIMVALGAGWPAPT